MIRLTAMVQATISKNQVMAALRAMTIRRTHFDPDPWSLDDAETLENAAALIRREIAEAAEAAEAAEKRKDRS
jgi:hypothetical protein